MSEFQEDINVSITEYLQNERDGAIKKILDLLDISSISDFHKKKVRQVILDELNGFYHASCKVLTYVQEHEKDS